MDIYWSLQNLMITSGRVQARQLSRGRRRCDASGVVLWQ